MCKKYCLTFFPPLLLRSWPGKGEKGEGGLDRAGFVGPRRRLAGWSYSWMRLGDGLVRPRRRLAGWSCPRRPLAGSVRGQLHGRSRGREEHKLAEHDAAAAVSSADVQQTAGGAISASRAEEADRSTSTPAPRFWDRCSKATYPIRPRPMHPTSRGTVPPSLVVSSDTFR